jgi:hypothetical protein
MPPTEHVQGQVTVAAAIAVEEPPLLLPGQRVVGGIQVEDQPLPRPLLGFKEQINARIGERLWVVVDLVVPVVGPQRRVPARSKRGPLHGARVTTTPASASSRPLRVSSTMPRTM